MLKNVDDTKRLLWEEIIKEAQELNVPLQEGEMTVRMFIEQTGFDYRWGREQLEKLVQSDKLKKRFSNLRGHRTAIYSPITSQ